MRALALALALLAGSAVVPLDRRAIEEALTIANSSLESTHRRYHADYRFPVNAPPVDFMSVVTPFRRLVLSAETEERLGRRMFGQREALAALQPDPDRFEIYVELTFHPHNTFVGVPAYMMELEPAMASRSMVLPLEIERLPRFGPRFDDTWYPFPYPRSTGSTVQLPASEPLRGGTLIGRFAGVQIDALAAYAVIVRDGKKELGRGRIDLARLR
jgi:hypothetical protein